MNAITKISSAAWHETPAVAAYLATVTVDDLSLIRPLIVMGDDQLRYTGDPVEQLSEMRREVIDALFGCTFRKAHASGRAYEYLDFEDENPSVDAVLSERFGDPRRFGNEHPDRATRLMRFDAQIKAAHQRHGIGEAA
ncbi:hypothetical protein EDF56_101175 [Novosphingobium sp. PhB165]|uniref:hypothetical protein n=1 Tax=Novosphingobium sp. PhB165 TaxID=2485105 RepID=UPI001049042F|nr:hypothetical protein [Novosphingobium sp. PhB165]TCM21511.1 hypothetical protein EDF56_101175 [Novosphingobium sp. PhB165]